MGTSISHVPQIVHKINYSRMSGAKTDVQNSAIASHQYFFPHLASSSKKISLYKTGSCDSSSFIDRVQQNRKYFNRISRPKMRSCFCVVYTTPHFCSNFPPLPSCFFFDDQLLKILCMKEAARIAYSKILRTS